MEITNKYQALWLLSERDRKERDLFYSRGLNSVLMPRDLKETQHHYRAAWGTCIFRSCLQFWILLSACDMAGAHTATVRAAGKKRQTPPHTPWVLSECLGSSPARGVVSRGGSHSTTSSRLDGSAGRGEYEIHASIEKITPPLLLFKESKLPGLAHVLHAHCRKQCDDVMMKAFNELNVSRRKWTCKWLIIQQTVPSERYRENLERAQDPRSTERLQW